MTCENNRTWSFAQGVWLCRMPLRYVDPHKKRGRWYRAFEGFIRSRSGELSVRHLFSHIDPWLYRATGGRYPAFLGALSTAPLMTTGAKSGQQIGRAHV